VREQTDLARCFVPRNKHVLHPLMAPDDAKSVYFETVDPTIAPEAVHPTNIASSVPPTHRTPLGVRLAANELLFDRASDSIDALGYLETRSGAPLGGAAPCRRPCAG